VQKSVFLGDIEPNRVNQIILASTELMNVETDSVYVFPMCQDDFENVRIVGQGFDRKLVANEMSPSAFRTNSDFRCSERRATWPFENSGSTQKRAR
jgi:CRISPR-associated protein Cas2